MLRQDYLDTHPYDEFLTSPLLQDDSPEETPFLATPGEDTWTSPMVDAADDSFGFGEMPLFGAVVKRADAAEPQPKQHTAPPSFDPSKADAAPRAGEPPVMYVFPPTPALAPMSLYNEPRRPSTLPLAPASAAATTTTTTTTTIAPSATASTSTSTSASAPAASSSTSAQPRPTKPLPTGTRRNITPAELLPLDAPTQHRQYVTPSATSRKALPAAFAKGKKRARSEVDGGPGLDADASASMGDDPTSVSADPETQEAIEAKRRQNTLAARRSRQRKLAHVRVLEESVERMTADRDMWMARAYGAEDKLRANGLEP
ncbi:hypothetical protein JB92DRAFT_3033996 [Gautieria morchelliformis]|nr:hypothetical protein JB92DRAFT_3033996 [Gautieria morchelliformis]